MTRSTDLEHTADSAGDTGYYAVNAGLVMQVFDMFEMRPSHFRASGQTGAHGVYYDARKISEGRTGNQWGHHTPGALKSFCHFTQSENGTLVPWRELVEHEGNYDGREGAGPRTGNRLRTERRLRLNHAALTQARRRRGLSREQLADETALPLCFIAALEDGSWGTVTDGTARAIAAALDMTQESLFSRQTDEAQPDTADASPDTPATLHQTPSTVHTGQRRIVLLLASVIGLLVLGMTYRFYAAGSPQPATPDWVRVSADGETPAVTLTRHEITNRDYRQFIEQQPAFNRDNMLPGMHDGDYLKHWLASGRYPPDSADHPVTYVSWYAAQAYCRWLGGRLPRLAEWRLATGAMSATLSADSVARLNLCDRGCAVRTDISPERLAQDVRIDDGYAETAPVTAGLRSAAGLTHLYGNVAEWLDETSGEQGAIIGGSFLATLSEAVSDKPVRTPKRLASRDVGFRCARTQP